MKRYPTPTEIAKKVSQGLDPFAPSKRIVYAPLLRQRKVYRYRRPLKEKERAKQDTGTAKRPDR